MTKTRIEWADAVWNPVSGCSPVSPGCLNCYAQRFARRLAGRYGYLKGNPFSVTLHPERVLDPLHWHKPRRIFVCSMGDLFHDDVPFDFVDQIMAVVALAPQHTFMVLTKRPARMLEYFASPERRVDRRAEIDLWRHVGGSYQINTYCGMIPDKLWPLPNLWVGTTVEDQKRADERIPILLWTPAALRFVSMEPMLGPIDLSDFKPFDGECYCQDGLRGCKPRLTPNCPETGVDWVICGGETGHGSRPMHPDWVRSLRDQCRNADVPFFFKSWGDLLPASQVLPEQDQSFIPTRKIYQSSSVDVFLGKEYWGRIGKKIAGRLLDGQEYSEFPAV
ncbi:MAG: phage Gp37/Gp68 family protein [Thermoplasmatales archaeon]